MDASLPQPVRLRLGQALAEWRRWSPAPAGQPEFTRLLPGGRSNTSCLVSAGALGWVVRIDGRDPRSLGLDRDVEWHCLGNAAAAGIAPRPVYRNPDCGVLVCVYHPPETGSADSIDALAGLLRRVHRLPPVRERLDPLNRARRYLRLAGTLDLPVGLAETCERLAGHPVPLRLCHNDLLRANRLYSRGQWLALDWEYAAMGDPWFDLAVVIEGDGLDESQAMALHEAWLERAPTAAELQRLLDQRRVYRALAALWEQLPG